MPKATATRLGVRYFEATDEGTSKLSGTPRFKILEEVGFEGFKVPTLSNTEGETVRCLARQARQLAVENHGDFASAVENVFGVDIVVTWSRG